MSQEITEESKFRTFVEDCIDEIDNEINRPDFDDRCMECEKKQVFDDDGNVIGMRITLSVLILN